MKMSKGRIISVAAFAAYIACIAALCLVRGETLPEISDNWLGFPADKVAHFIMFTPFIPLSYMTFRPTSLGVMKRLILVLFLTMTGIAMAYMTEWLQERTGHRSYEVADIYADIIGLMVGAISIIIFILIRHTKFSSNR